MEEGSKMQALISNIRKRKSIKVEMRKLRGFLDKP